MNVGPEKVKASHLERDAYVYVQEGALPVVGKSTECMGREIALEQRAISLGWPPENVHVID